MILSFTWTSDVLLSGQKTCTRRRWQYQTAKRWTNAWENGRYIHDAWNKIPLCPGAKKIADIRLTQKPYPEPLAAMPFSDLEAEGGLWESTEEFISLFGGDPNLAVWVVRFELVEKEQSLNM